MIECRRVIKAQKGFRLSLPSLQLFPGLTLLIGKNGSGKSTLLKLLATIWFPDSGQIRYGGHTAAERLPQIRAEIGYVPANLEWYEDMKVGEQLRYLASLKGLDARLEAERAMERFNLTPYRDRKIKTLAIGVHQLIAVAQALMGTPRLLLLDEPLQHLDASQRRHVIAVLCRYARNRWVVAATHEPDAWGEGIDEIIWLHEGQLRFQGSPTQWLTALPDDVWQKETATDDPSWERHNLLSVVPDNDAGKSLVRCHGPEAPAEDWCRMEPTLEESLLIRLKKLPR